MGCFTEEAGERFVGKDVLGDGNTDVIAALGECGVLIKEEVRAVLLYYIEFCCLMLFKIYYVMGVRSDCC